MQECLDIPNAYGFWSIFPFGGSQGSSAICVLLMLLVAKKKKLP